MKFLTKYILAVTYSIFVPLGLLYFISKYIINHTLSYSEITMFTVLTICILFSCLAMFAMLNIKLIPRIKLKLNPAIVFGIETTHRHGTIYVYILCIRIDVQPKKLTK